MVLKSHWKFKLFVCFGMMKYVIPCRHVHLFYEIKIVYSYYILTFYFIIVLQIFKENVNFCTINWESYNAWGSIYRLPLESFIGKFPVKDSSGKRYTIDATGCWLPCLSVQTRAMQTHGWNSGNVPRKRKCKTI